MIKPVRPAIRVLCLIFIILFGEHAAASVTFNFKFVGESLRYRDAWECPSCDPYDLLYPSVSPWLGTLSVTTTGSADGTYALRNALDFQSSSNLKGLSAIISGFGTPWTGEVSIASGKIASISAYYEDPGFSSLSIFDFTVRYWEFPQHHFGGTEATATLVPIPEQGTAAMMLSGIVIVALRRRVA